MSLLPNLLTVGPSILFFLEYGKRNSGVMRITRKRRKKHARKGGKLLVTKFQGPMSRLGKVLPQLKDQRATRKMTVSHKFVTL